MPYLCNDRVQWTGKRIKKSVTQVQRASLPVHFREVQRDGRPTGSLELHRRIGRRREVPNIPECLWLEKRRGREKEGEGRLGVSEEKGRLKVT